MLKCKSQHTLAFLSATAVDKTTDLAKVRHNREMKF
jgi:hypothetical protein